MRLALRLAALALTPCVSAAQPALPQRGAAGDVDGGVLYEFVTQPDSSVLIRSSRGDSLRIEPQHLRRISAAYGGDLDGSNADLRRGYNVEDGSLVVYYARRIPLRTAVLVLGVLGVLAAAFVTWALRRISRDARRKEELQTYRETLAAAREEERLRISREIHDGPLQSLHVLRTRAVLSEPDLEADLLSTARELRRVIEGLRPPDLDRYSLTDAVRALVRRFEQANRGVRVKADLVADDPAIDTYDDRLQLTLYRIVQEALHNVAAHAGARSLTLSFEASAERYELRVKDDGAGFDVGAGAPNGRGRFGLVGMAERAEAVGADLSVRSRPGAGTQLTLVGVPVEAPVASR